MTHQFFHSKTSQPMLPWEDDVDSDDDSPEGWIIDKQEQVRHCICTITPPPRGQASGAASCVPDDSVACLIYDGMMVLLITVTDAR